MSAERSELSDPGGAKGPSRRSASLVVSVIGACCALLLVPFALIALLGALPGAASTGQVSVGFLAVVGVGSAALSLFGFAGAGIAREANSPGLRAFGWTIGLTLIAAGICFGVAAILHATA